MRLLLFIAIMLLFGSLSRPPIVPCSKNIVSRYYLNGNLVHVDKEEYYYEYNIYKQVECNMHDKLKFNFNCDSVTHSLK
mgnify:CR=1 FL=1